jgi:hypothetical protein
MAYDRLLPAGLYFFHLSMFANLTVSVGLHALLQFLVKRWLVWLANVLQCGLVIHSCFSVIFFSKLSAESFSNLAANLLICVPEETGEVRPDSVRNPANFKRLNFFFQKHL